MKIDVFDTYVTPQEGATMHFDVLIPAGGGRASAERFARQWLETIGVSGQLCLEKCQFCHSELLMPANAEEMATQGFSILPLEGCPSIGQ